MESVETKYLNSEPLSVEDIKHSNHVRGANKAWETRRKNKELGIPPKSQTKKKEKVKKESYDRPKKNDVRDKLVEIFDDYHSKTILTLDTEEYLFSKRFPQHKILIAEHDKKRYHEMLKTKPDNVFLYHGDIGDFADFDFKIDIVYLDFCCTQKIAKPIMDRLRHIIMGSKVSAFTFALRKNVKLYLNDYQFNLLKEFDHFYGTFSKQLEFAEAYHDAGPMVTICFDHSNRSKYGAENNRKVHLMRTKTISYCNRSQPKYGVDKQILSINCKTCLSELLDQCNDHAKHLSDNNLIWSR